MKDIVKMYDPAADEEEIIKYLKVLAMVTSRTTTFTVISDEEEEEEEETHREVESE